MQQQDCIPTESLVGIISAPLFIGALEYLLRGTVKRGRKVSVAQAAVCQTQSSQVQANAQETEPEHRAQDTR